MRQLTIIYVRHAAPGCCKGNGTGLERLSCDNEWLISDVCLSSGCRSCEDYDLCPAQDIEVVIDWLNAVMWGAIRMSNSPIGGASEFSCAPGSVAREVRCAGAFSTNRC